MGERIEEALNNPQLYYRLDLGEPGLLKSAQASESAMKVTAQERRNLQRFKFDAFMRGEEVIFADIKYLYGIDGSFSSIRAGRTTVVTRKGKSHQIEETPSTADKGAPDQSSPVSELETKQDPMLRGLIRRIQHSRLSPEEKSRLIALVRATFDELDVGQKTEFLNRMIGIIALKEAEWDEVME